MLKNRALERSDPRNCFRGVRFRCERYSGASGSRREYPLVEDDFEFSQVWCLLAHCQDHELSEIAKAAQKENIPVSVQINSNQLWWNGTRTWGKAGTFASLKIGVVESNGHQNYHWEEMKASSLPWQAGMSQRRYLSIR